MREANPYAGEVGIDFGGRHFKFRPSFLALTKLGTPSELIKLLDAVQRPDRVGFSSCLSIFDSCYIGTRGGSDRLTGFFSDQGGRLKYTDGALSCDEIRVIGARLLINGMIGKPYGVEGGDKPCDEFDPMEFIGSACAHLGLRVKDAEQLTMIEFQKAMHAKYPPEKKDVPTQDDYDDLLAAIEANGNG